MCVPCKFNPQPFAMLTQYSTTEPQEHYALNTDVWTDKVQTFLFNHLRLDRLHLREKERM